MGGKNSKDSPPTVMILFQLFLKVSSDNPHKNYQLGFNISNQFKKKLIIVANG